MTKKLNVFQQVRELSGWKAKAFSATLLERMIPNYVLFCEATEFADSSQFKNSLASIWDHLASPKAKINFSVQLEKIEEQIPDAQDFDSFGVYPAIDAAMSLVAAIQLIMGDEEQGAVIVSKLSQGSVEAVIDATSEQPLSREDSKEHPLMQWEVAFQQELVTRLQDIKIGKDACRDLREFAKEEGISNIGVELD